VPQGDIISPQLFILMVEILLIKITRSKNIQGIVYVLKEGKAEAFADDTTLFMTRSPKNLRAATKYIQDFHTISGLASNLRVKFQVRGTKTVEMREKSVRREQIF
jgi:hypothetical protein